MTAVPKYVLIGCRLCGKYSAPEEWVQGRCPRCLRKE
jgi:hypothetical protein